MRTRYIVAPTLGVALIAALTVAATPNPSISVENNEDGAPGAVAGTWKLEAKGARLVGGYGDNFAYNGDNVRAIDATATIELDTQAGRGTITIEAKTTRTSGPIRFSAGDSWSGDIRIVQRLNLAEMDMARIEESVYLHGDTGNEAPVMPNMFNYFATWGPSKIWVNGEEVVPMIGSHTMFSEQARDASGKIQKDGTVYGPMAPEKDGFTDASKTEFHFVAHTTEPDSDNFPPHTAWLHLHFSDVTVIQKPADVSIPYQD